MRTQSIDTSPDAERVLIGMIRKAPVSRRFGFVQSWTRSMIEGGKLNVKQVYPGSTSQDVELLYAERQYGKDVADELRTAVQERHVRFPVTFNFYAAFSPLIEVLENLNVSYALGGSLASSLYGMQRATLQIDFIAALSLHQARFLVKELAVNYFFHEQDVQIALKRKTSFTLIHLESLLKVVVSLSKPRAFDRQVLDRARPLGLIEGYRPIPVLSPEDVVVLQLEQFKNSSEQADDVWYDLLGLLKVQRDALDLVYLDKWAEALNLSELLERALMDAGLIEMDEIIWKYMGRLAPRYRWCQGAIHSARLDERSNVESVLNYPSCASTIIPSISSALSGSISTLSPSFVTR